MGFIVGIGLYSFSKLCSVFITKLSKLDARLRKVCSGVNSLWKIFWVERWTLRLTHGVGLHWDLSTMETVDGSEKTGEQII